MQAKVIALCNHKGGVGKTTSVVSLGTALAEKGKKVLLVDLDQQANLTLSLYGNEEPERDMADAITDGSGLPVLNIGKKLDLSPASINLAGVEDFLLELKEGREYRLKTLLEPVRANYDYILLDCPPSLARVVINAFVAATGVIVPLTAEPLPLNGLSRIEEVIGLVKKEHNKDLQLSGVLITKWKGRALEKQVEETLRANYGELVFKTRIRENIAIAEAPLEQKSVLQYAPSSNGAKDYKELAKELLKR